MNRQEFIENIAKYVCKYSDPYNIKVHSPIIAQAILESGYGESILSSKYNNHFGLKCGGAWSGKSVNLETLEERDNSLHHEFSDFRVYDSFEEGVLGYFTFIDWSNYSNLKGVTDPQTYCENIYRDGYATDSNYVDKLMSLIREYNLTLYDNKNQNNETNISTDKLIELVKIARRVYLGEFGNGENRKSNLTNAGYDYSLIQDIVNVAYYDT